MSERTGATDAQIEAAAKRMHDVRKQPNKVPHGDWPCALCAGQAEAWAEAFVPTGIVIARAADVLTAEQRAAIGRALETFESDTDLFIARSETDAMTDGLRLAYDRFYQAKKSFTTADRELIRAIAEGGTE